MKKIDAGEYRLSAGEQVTIKVTPTGLAPFVAAARSGKVMTPQPGTAATKPTYVFNADKSSIVKMEFSFPGAPATAKYDVVITGSGGGDTGGFTILQTASIKDPNIRFMVV
jgi:hypothetical protein